MKHNGLQILIAMMAITIYSSTVNAETTRDPMRPAIIEMPSIQIAEQKSSEENKQPIEQYTVNQIIITKQKSYARINGKMMAEGEKINEAIIRKIEPNQVKLSINGKTSIRMITPVNIKSSPQQAVRNTQ